MAELRRRGAEVDSAERDEDEEESKGGVAEDVVGDGCHEGEKEGEQKLRVGVGSVFHIREGTHLGGCVARNGHIMGKCKVVVWF
jgi:hypothetical protein